MKKPIYRFCASLLALIMILGACGAPVADPVETTGGGTQGSGTTAGTSAPSTSTPETEPAPDLPEMVLPDAKREEIKMPSFDLATPAAAIMAEKRDPGDRAYWIAQVDKLLNYNAEDPAYSLSADSTNYAWGTAYFQDAMYYAYLSTKDNAYLDFYALMCYNMLSTLEDKDGDGYLGWGSAHYHPDNEYEEFAVHTGLCIMTLARFAQLVRADESLWELKGDISQDYKTLADRIADVCDNHLIPSFYKDFREDIGVLMNRPGGGNYSGITKLCTLPHNQYLAYASGLYAAAALSPEHAKKYLSLADAMTAAFKSFIKTRKDGTMFWNYDDPHFLTDHAAVFDEDHSHAWLDYYAAMDSYNRGAIFSLEDLQYFGENVVKYMFNKNYEDPKIAGSVKGYGGGTERTEFQIPLGHYFNEVWEICAAPSFRGTDGGRILLLHPDSGQPEEFSLAFPKEGAVVPADVTAFSWTPSARAADYYLEIATDEAFNNLVVSRPYICVTAVPVDCLSPNTTYYWRITARSASGLLLQSEARSFKTDGGTPKDEHILSFDMKAPPVAAEYPGKITVYVNHAPVAQVPFFEDEDWHRVKLDISDIAAGKTSLSVRIELAVVDETKDYSKVFVDNISLSGSSTPTWDFEDPEQSYIFKAGPFSTSAGIEFYSELGIKPGNAPDGSMGVGFIMADHAPGYVDPGYVRPNLSQAYIQVGFNLE